MLLIDWRCAQYILSAQSLIEHKNMWHILNGVLIKTDRTVPLMCFTFKYKYLGKVKRFCKLLAIIVIIRLSVYILILVPAFFLSVNQQNLTNCFGEDPWRYHWKRYESVDLSPRIAIIMCSVVELDYCRCLHTHN